MSQQINLFNPIFLQQKKIFSTRTMAQALGVLVLPNLLFVTALLSLLAVTTVSAFILRRRMIMFFGLIVVLSVASETIGDRVDVGEPGVVQLQDRRE